MKLGLLAISATVLLVFAFGCSDSSDALSLDEYFAEFEAIDADVDAQFEAAFEEAFVGFEDEEDFFADEANLPALKEITATFPRILGDAIDRMKVLNPPSEVETEHDNLIDAGDNLVVAFEEGVDVIEEAETLEEVDAFLELSPTIDAAEAVFDAACLDLVAVGEANGVTVNVTCEDEE